MEPNTVTKHMAYGQFSNLARVRDAYIAGKLKLPLEADSLRNSAIPNSSIFPTKRSLEDLGWFDNGQPTELFLRLARAYQSNQAEYQDILKRLLNHLYAEVFAYVAREQIDLAQTIASKIAGAFSDYEPRNQTLRMAYLFLALAREANLIPEGKNVPHLANGKFAPKSGQAIGGLTDISVSEEGTSGNDLPQDSMNGRTAMHQDAKTSRVERQRKYVLELLETLPDEEGHDREWWVDALRSNVDLLIKLFTRKDESMKT